MKYYWLFKQGGGAVLYVPPLSSYFSGNTLNNVVHFKALHWAFKGTYPQPYLQKHTTLAALYIVYSTI